MWQAIRDELAPQGLEVVTVALDLNRQAAVAAIERAAPTHPSLIDQAHLCDELLGIVNVPSGVWIDEDGMIVRPPEPAFPERTAGREGYRPPRRLPDDLDPYLRAVLEEAGKIRSDPRRYTAALRDWVALGRDSRFALSPDEVIAKSRSRPPESARAAAHFELGQRLWRDGHEDDAVPHFREAHRLQPDNWTYKRQAWVLANPLQGPTEQYDSDWLTDVRKIGAENYYEPLDMPDP